MSEPCFFHVDMDAFYAAVEQRDNPQYAQKPVIIGALPGTRGVVSACSYEARLFGVHSAMPISEASRRCPNGVFLIPRMQHYAAVSSQIMARFKNYSPVVQQISIDEAFLDMTGTRRLFGPPIKIAENLKKEIRSNFGLNISVGIAANRYLAKMASEYRKPDGLYRVIEGQETAFLDSLSLKDIWGLGKKTIERLENFNICSVQDLRDTEKPILSRIVGSGAAEFLSNAVRGIDPGIFSQEPKSRSISNETTFPEDTNDSEVIYQTLLDLSHQVMFRCMESNVSSKTIQIKVRFSDFSTTTARITLRKAAVSAEEIYSIARDLLKQRWKGSAKLRLIGVGLSNTSDSKKENQAELFEDSYDRRKKVEEAVYELNRRYHQADKGITKARLVKSSDTKKEKNPLKHPGST